MYTFHVFQFQGWLFICLIPLLYICLNKFLFINIVDLLFLRQPFFQNTKSTEYIGDDLLMRYCSQEVFILENIFPVDISLDLFFSRPTRCGKLIIDLETSIVLKYKHIYQQDFKIVEIVV